MKRFRLRWIHGPCLLDLKNDAGYILAGNYDLSPWSDDETIPQMRGHIALNLRR